MQLPVSASDGTSSGCSSGQAGRVRFLARSKVAQLCDGDHWLNIMTAPAAQTEETESDLGRSENSSASSCLEIKQEGQ